MTTSAPVSTTAPADVEVDAFAASLDEFLRATRRARARWRTEGDLTLSQFLLLEPLVDSEAPMTSGAVAEHAGISAPTATRMLDVLQRKGMIERVRGAEDRRCVHVIPTEEGIGAVRDRRDWIHGRRERIFAALGPVDGAAAIVLLGRLAAAFDDER